MDKNDQLQKLITDFIETVEAYELSGLDALGTLSFLTGLYQQMSIETMDTLAKEHDANQGG